MFPTVNCLKGLSDGGRPLHGARMHLAQCSRIQGYFHDLKVKCTSEKTFSIVHLSRHLPPPALRLLSPLVLTANRCQQKHAAAVILPLSIVWHFF